MCNRRFPRGAQSVLGLLAVSLGLALPGLSGEAPVEPPVEPPGAEPAPAPAPAAHELAPATAKVMTIDGKVIEGDLTGADATSITISTAQGPKSIALVNTIEINYATEGHLRPAGLQLLFLDGSSLAVDQVVSATEETIKVKGITLGGEATFPVDRTIGVIFDLHNKRAKEYRDAILTRQVDSDFVLLPNVDSVAGRLQFKEWTGRNVAIEVDGQKREFKEEESAGVKFQVLAERTALPPVHVNIALIDGSELQGVFDSVAAGKLVFNVQNTKVTLVSGAIRTLRVVGSRMRYLSDLQPAEVEEYPYLKTLPTAFPMHVDRTCAGKPISVNGKSYAHGIGVHAYSHLTYALDRKFEMFYTRVGIDDHMSKPGMVKYAVLVDGETRKSGSLSSNKADSLEVNVKGARKLELIVTFGDDSDQGDSVVWANARLIEIE